MAQTQLGGMTFQRRPRYGLTVHIGSGECSMKTTLNLNDRVLHLAKRQAARDGVTLTRFVEDALRARLAAARDRKRGFRLRLETVKGTAPPNVDIADRIALHDVIDRAGSG